MHNARFMLVETQVFRSNPVSKWIIISSSNCVLTYATIKELDKLISYGTVRPNNFGHNPLATPERIILSQAKIIEHHGYFRTLKDVRDYIQMMELLNNV